MRDDPTGNEPAGVVRAWVKRNGAGAYRHIVGALFSACRLRFSDAFRGSLAIGSRKDLRGDVSPRCGPILIDLSADLVQDAAQQGSGIGNQTWNAPST